MQLCIGIVLFGYTSIESCMHRSWSVKCNLKCKLLAVLCPREIKSDYLQRNNNLNLNLP